MARLLTRALTASSAAALVAVGWAWSCSPRIPTPPRGPHTSSDKAVIVTSMPDTVQVETVPASPSDDAVWVDGSWEWAGRRWVWTAGSWQVPPQGAYYARPSVMRLPIAVRESPDGGGPIVGYSMQLLFIPGDWHLVDGGTWKPDAADGGAK